MKSDRRTSSPIRAEKLGNIQHFADISFATGLLDRSLRMFNAIKYTQELEKAGFSRDQAEASVKLLIEVMDQNLATKSDLKDLRSEIKELGSSIRSDMREIEYKLVFRLGSLMTVLIGVAVAILKSH
jgi:hypothetical protein